MGAGSSAPTSPSGGAGHAATAASPPTPAAAAPTVIAEIRASKDEARSERLKSMNSVKNRIWNEWQKHCLKECDDEVRDYWICREEQGLMAPVRCSAASDAMKAALQKCGRDEAAFGEYRARRLNEVEADIVARIKRQTEADAAKGLGGAGAAGAAGGAR